MVQEADTSLRAGKDHEIWLSRLETEHDNLRATLAWSGTDAEDAQRGLQIAALLWQFWSVRNHISEGREHLKRALERKGAHERTRWRSRALNIAGNLADNQGDYAAARALFLESVDIRKEIGARTGELIDTEAVVHSYHGLGHLAVRQDDPVTARAMYEEARDAAAELVQRQRDVGDRSELSFALLVSGHVASDMADYATALRLYEDCLSLRRQLGDRHGVGEVFSYMGLLAGRTGDYSAAHTFYLESLASRLELGNQRGIALSYDELGRIAFKQGDYAAARNYYEKAMPIFNKLGDRQYVAHCLEGLAAVMLALGEPLQAGRLWGTAAGIRTTIGAPWRLDERAEIEPLMNQVRLALGEDAFTVAWTEGQGLTWEQVVGPEAVAVPTGSRI
jgi:tetratricopeptide (TPR) repeat protein